METAIISGKGGTGKSCVAAAFASLAKEVVLADCDVDTANLYIIFNPENKEVQTFVGSHEAMIDRSVCCNCGKCIDYCRFDALKTVNGQVLVSEIFCEGCGLCARVCPVQAIDMKENKNSRLYAGDFRYGHMVYGRLAPGEENSGKLVSLVRDKAQKIAENQNVNTLIMDGPPGIGCPVMATITGVDQVVIVTEPTISGLHDMKRIWSLSKHYALPTCVIINKYDLQIVKSREIEKFCAENGLRIVGRLPFDPMVVEAMVHCKSVTEWVPESRVASELKSAFTRIFSYNP